MAWRRRRALEQRTRAKLAGADGGLVYASSRTLAASAAEKGESDALGSPACGGRKGSFYERARAATRAGALLGSATELGRSFSEVRRRSSFRGVEALVAGEGSLSILRPAFGVFLCGAPPSPCSGLVQQQTPAPTSSESPTAASAGRQSKPAASESLCFAGALPGTVVFTNAGDVTATASSPSPLAAATWQALALTDSPTAAGAGSPLASRGRTRRFFYPLEVPAVRLGGVGTGAGEAGGAKGSLDRVA